jgi:mRNA-degrading endonuclease RelE of RelBE toxin-antitoxin system
MIIIETPTFTRQIEIILSDEEYRKLQNLLMEHPDLGAVIPATKGLRKLRFAESGKGKRGGGRLIYYWLVNNEVLYMVYTYRKSEAEDLTKTQLKQLSKQVEEYINES